eukprot:13236-Heterococcus_DN1.PRE.1
MLLALLCTGGIVNIQVDTGALAPAAKKTTKKERDALERAEKLKHELLDKKSNIAAIEAEVAKEKAAVAKAEALAARADTQKAPASKPAAVGKKMPAGAAATSKDTAKT